MAFDLLTTLDPTARRAILLVRVSRKWEYRGGTDDGPIQHVDLVLIDTQGNAMYAEIPGTEVQSKSPLVEEGGVYIISRFRVSNAKHSFRPVAGAFMIEFTCHTHVSIPREASPAIPFVTYSRLTPIADLKSHAGDTRDFIDVIGIITEVSAPYSVRLPNKPRPTLTRHVVLRDQGYSEMKVSLWGERASAFNVDEVAHADGEKPVILLLVGCLMKKYQDTYYLSGNTAARWYFNPDILEARQFNTSFHDHNTTIRRVPAPVQLEDEEDTSNEPENKTLAELIAMDPYDYADNGYRVTVTIGRLVPNVSWWFASCTRCSKSCAPYGSGYKCNSCSSDSFRFKYKICFVAFDGTAEAEMICFGDVARYLVGKPVQQVLRATTPATPVPVDITRIVARRWFNMILLPWSHTYNSKTVAWNVDVAIDISNIPPHACFRRCIQPMLMPHCSINSITCNTHQGTCRVTGFAYSVASIPTASTIGVQYSETHGVSNDLFPVTLRTYRLSEAPTFSTDPSPPMIDTTLETAVEFGVDPDMLKESYEAEDKAVWEDEHPPQPHICHHDEGYCTSDVPEEDEEDGWESDRSWHLRYSG